MMIEAEESWYPNENKSARVKEGDPRARYLLVAKGQKIDEVVFQAVPEAEPIKVETETKAVKKPPADK